MFIPKRKKKILEVFLSQPFKEIHLREIARLSEVSLSHVKDSLHNFVAEDIFIRRDISNMTFFKPNFNNEQLLKIFECLELERKKDFYNKNRNIARLLQQYTDKAIELSDKRMQLLILFGSVARGQWTKKSDIDILAVATEEDRNIIGVLNKAKEDIGPLLRISPITTSAKKFIKGFKQKAEFYEELFNDRIVLYNEFLFWQLVKEGGE